MTLTWSFQIMVLLFKSRFCDVYANSVALLVMAYFRMHDFQGILDYSDDASGRCSQGASPFSFCFPVEFNHQPRDRFHCLSRGLDGGFSRQRLNRTGVKHSLNDCRDYEFSHGQHNNGCSSFWLIPFWKLRFLLHFEVHAPFSVKVVARPGHGHRRGLDLSQPG